MKRLGPAALLALAGCGYVGPPLPPALAVPGRIGDFTAIEFGDRIEVTFTIPMLDSDGLPLKKLRAVNVYAGTNAAPFTPESWAATARVYPAPVSAPGAVMFDEIRAADWAGKLISLGARVTGPKGKTSGWSNLVTIEVGQPLAAPTAVVTQNLKDGVGLSWKGPGPKYRVLRSSPGGAPQQIADTDKPEYLDTTTQYGTPYEYRVLTVVRDTYMSAPSEPQSITPKDEFPPDVPAGVTAIAGVSTIEVSWDANTEADFKGYNVWRAVDDGAFVLAAPSIETPSYSDSKVEAGKTYRYAISALDLLNNQSARSQPVLARLP